MSGLRIHKRERIVNVAVNEMRDAVQKIVDQHDLTTWEMVRAVSSVCNSLLQGEARMGIRMERHGNYEEEGGLD